MVVAVGSSTSRATAQAKRRKFVPSALCLLERVQVVAPARDRIQ